MKKIILLFVAFVAQTNFAQSIFPTDGSNVGIGTTTPLAKLTIFNGNPLVKNINNIDNLSSIMVAQSIKDGDIINFGTSIRSITQSAANNTYAMQFFTQESYSLNQTEKLRIQGNGNVGIGTSAPLHKLDVNGHTIVRGAIISSMSDDGGGQLQLKNPSKTVNGAASTWMIYNMTGGYGNSLQFWAYDNVGCGTGLCNNRFTIMDSGNVGIGTTTPTNKLDVNGTIHSKEVKVDMLDWPDYVFKKEYNLPTLEEVEKQINEKGHLQNIPSEEEVLKNGINLGEMNAKLLQKMEEMTLYMIEIKKENEAVKKENALMKKNQIELEKRILKIENK